MMLLNRLSAIVVTLILTVVCLFALMTLAIAGERNKGSNPAAAQSASASFLAENKVAMDKMMADMHINPSGDVDRDFAVMMIAHHQGAIDMAQALLKYGANTQLRGMAQDIIAAQQQEIAVMRQIIRNIDAVRQTSAPAGAVTPSNMHGVHQ